MPSLTGSPFRKEVTPIFLSVRVLCYGLGPSRDVQEILEEEEKEAEEENGNAVFQFLIKCKYL